MFRTTWLALCLTAFTTGCVKTETVVVTKTIAAIPPRYLYDSEPVPEVPDGVPPEERTEYLLEAFASRKDVIRRDQKQEVLMDEWVEAMRKLYPGSVEQPLPDSNAATNAPQDSGE